MPDALVSITGSSLIGGTRSIMTDVHGRYLLTLLPPGTYDIAIGRRGFRAVRRAGIRLAAGATLTVDAVLEIADIDTVLAAEHGGFTGVAAGAVVRSGGNRFSGLGEFWMTRPNWLSRNTGALSADLGREFEPRRIVEWWDSSTQAGGPIVANRLWFFSGLQYGRHDDQPAGYAGSGWRDERDVQAIAKVNAAVTPDLRVEGFINRGGSTWPASTWPR